MLALCHAVAGQLGGFCIEEGGPVDIEGLDPLAGHHHEPVDLIQVLIVFGRLQLERAQVVVGDKFGHVLHTLAAGRLEPAGHLTVQTGPFRSGELPVGHVSYENVRERVFLLSLHGRAPHRPY